MFTPAARAAAVSPETAVIIPDYPYGFRLRCMMRVWVEYKAGKGFRYCTQTSNPKKPGTVWNKPKAGTYSRVSMAIGQTPNGLLFPSSLTEYSDLDQYAAFVAEHGPALSHHAAASLEYFRSVKAAYEAKRAELGVDNIYTTTPENQTALRLCILPVLAAHQKAGTEY
jgi:hypothetical protein